MWLLKSCGVYVVEFGGEFSRFALGPFTVLCTCVFFYVFVVYPETVFRVEAYVNLRYIGCAVHAQH